MRRLLLIAIVATGATPGACASRFDSRAAMLASAGGRCPDFPDERSVKLTRFAHIGTIATPDGPIHVVWQDAVGTGMLAPRGSHAIQYFDHRYQWFATETGMAVTNYQHPPLYAEGPYLYFFGAVGFRALLGDVGWEPVGNALGFSDGFEARRLVYRECYCSWTPSERSSDGRSQRPTSNHP